MTRLEALEETYAAVERGNVHFLRDDVTETAFEVKPYDEKVGYVRLIVARRFTALSAAQSLHEAVLPDEGWEVWRTAKYPGMIPGSSPYAFKAKVGWGTTHIGAADTPARAWLLAILRALIAIEKGKG